MYELAAMVELSVKYLKPDNYNIRKTGPVSRNTTSRGQ